jgi:hypothetical protein
MDVQQIIEMLKSMQEKADADRKAYQERWKAERKDYQEKVEAENKAWLERMETIWQADREQTDIKLKEFTAVAWQHEVRRYDANSDLFTLRLSSARVGYPRHGTEKTPLRPLLRNLGSVFRCY